MSPKSLRSTMGCAICKREVNYHATDLPDIESALKKHHPAARNHGEGWTRNVSSDWACESCITQGLALKADPLKQSFMGYSGPYFAYWDRAGNCEYCPQEFVFTAAEQMYWYEEARFHPKSRPVGCQNCRTVLRERKTAQRRLQEFLSEWDSRSWRDLVKVADFEFDLRSQKNVLLHLRQAKNLCDDDEAKASIVRRIAEMEVMDFEPWPERRF